MPKISVIMGMYNTKSKEYLEKSLMSILNQTFKDFELIICNDGSTNECIKWAKAICKNDKRVIFIENEKNMGLAYTLNHCLKYAHGEYIARMDDDDFSHKDRFEKQIKYLEQHKSVDLVSCNINLFDENGIYNTLSYPKHIIKKDFLFNSPIVHPAIMTKRSAFDKVKGYRDTKETVRVEDYDLFMRMFSKGIKMDVLQDVLFDYRDDKENSIRRKKYKYRLNEFIVRLKGFKKLHLYPIGIFYAFKPLIVGFIPTNIIRKIRERQN